MGLELTPTKSDVLETRRDANTAAISRRAHCCLLPPPLPSHSSHTRSGQNTATVAHTQRSMPHLLRPQPTHTQRPARPAVDNSARCTAAPSLVCAALSNCSDLFVSLHRASARPPSHDTAALAAQDVFSSQPPPRSQAYCSVPSLFCVM